MFCFNKKPGGFHSLNPKSQAEESSDNYHGSVDNFGLSSDHILGFEAVVCYMVETQNDRESAVETGHPWISVRVVSWEHQGADQVSKGKMAGICRAAAPHLASYQPFASSSRHNL